MSPIEDLLQQCTVKLTLPDQMGWGTGFFVAPGWILTCAHVVRAADQFPQLRSLQQAFHGGDRRWSDLLTKDSEIDFQAYLEAIARHYAQWWRLYTLTDAEGRQAQKTEPFFDFGLMVQTVVPKDDRPDRPEAKEKVERFTVLDGLRKCVAPDQDQLHVLLVGRPGSWDE
jgi:hypothetical protein